MSDFLLPRFAQLDPYVPGEQPQDRQYVKLNTNESPFPPSPRVMDALSREAIARLNLYPDPLAKTLRETIALEYAVSPEQVFVSNGSDDVLGFAFMAYADQTHGVTIPEVSYGFYQVYAKRYQIQPTVVPLNEDFTLPVKKFLGQNQLVAFANPNAPTSLAMPLGDVERIVAENPRGVVLVDEAYVDYGGETSIPLLAKYPNLLIVRTFSKSRSLAGGRLGYALASPALIEDLDRMKNTFNPYSVNSLTMVAGIEAMRDRAYFDACVASTCKQRAVSAAELRSLGFRVLDSAANFLFAAAPGMDGLRYYQKLKERGVLVRYLNQPTLRQFVRITVGSEAQMRALTDATRDILKEETV